MKRGFTEILIILLLCFVKLFKVVSSNERPKSVDIIDNFIGLVETNNSEIEKRNSIVDGGVFVPYKSTTIVYKSRLVPVTYGFVIKKETLNDNPALYKLGVKLLDEKVEQTPKELLGGKKVTTTPATVKQNGTKLGDQQKLEAKSNCVEGSKVLRLLAKLTRDINKIEEAIVAQNQTVESKQHKLITKPLKILKRPHPQSEAHVAGHKGAFENNLSKTKSQKYHISKNLSRYWQCRRSHTKRKCAVLLLMKHAHDGRHVRKHSARHGSARHYSKNHRKRPAKYQHLHNVKDVNTRHSKEDNSDELLDKYKGESSARNHSRKAKHPGKFHSHLKKHLDRRKAQRLNSSAMYRSRQKSHLRHHRERPARVTIKNNKDKHSIRHDNEHKQDLKKHNNDIKRQPIPYRKKPKKHEKKKKQG